MNEYNYKGYTIRIEQDDMPESPREWDNLGTMVCKHKRYDLGDKEASKQIPWEDFSSWQEVENYILKTYDVLAILPIFMYEHSGITIKTTGYSDSFDSGQVGFIFIEKDKVRKEFNVKKISKKLKEKITDILNGEVKTYDQYLTGDVYWYRITDEEGEEIDSCGGYYGYDYVKAECEAIVERLPHNNAEKFILNIEDKTNKGLLKLATV